MSRYSRLDGFGEDTFNLDECRRFLVGRCLTLGPGPSLIDENTLVAYYRTPDHRWVQGLGGMHQLRHGGEGYTEIHPILVVRHMLLVGINLPPELGPFRSYGDDSVYCDWCATQGGGTIGSKDARDGTLDRYPAAFALPGKGSSDPDAYIDFKTAQALTALEPYQITRACDNEVRSIGKGRGRKVHAIDLANFVMKRK